MKMEDALTDYKRHVHSSVECCSSRLEINADARNSRSRVSSIKSSSSTWSEEFVKQSARSRSETCQLNWLMLKLVLICPLCDSLQLKFSGNKTVRSWPEVGVEQDTINGWLRRDSWIEQTLLHRRVGNIMIRIYELCTIFRWFIFSSVFSSDLQLSVFSVVSGMNKLSILEKKIFEQWASRCFYL